MPRVCGLIASLKCHQRIRYAAGQQRIMSDGDCGYAVDTGRGYPAGYRLPAAGKRLHGSVNADSRDQPVYCLGVCNRIVLTGMNGD